MGGFAKCCCACECVLLEELPTITIGGMTGGGWQGLTCCFRQGFNYNTTPTESVIVTDPIYSSSATQDRTQEVNTTTTYRAPMFSFPGPGDFCEDADYTGYCCPGRDILMGTIREILNETIQRKLKVTYSPVSVEVTYSKQKVDCDGVELCRYVVKLSFFYFYEYVYLTERQSSRQVISTPGGGCFVCAGPDNNGRECSFTDESEGTIESGGGSGSFRIDRIKYYESAPTGTITFVTSDVDTCDQVDPNFGCDTEGNYVSQVCVNAELESPPCWCGTALVGFEEDTWANPSGETCQPYALVYTCGNTFCAASADFCEAETVPCEYSVQCSGVQLPEGCSRAVFLLTGLYPFWQVGDQNFSFFPDCCISQGLTVCSSYPFASKSNCDDVPIGSGLECDEDCCHSYIDFEENCANCNLLIISCIPKYNLVDRTVTAHTLTTSCSGPTARSACIRAPSSFQIVLS